MESNSSVANDLELGIMILYYIPESLKTYIGYIRRKEYEYGEYSASNKRGDIRKLHYLVSGAIVAESVSIVPEQILAYMSGDTWIDADTLVPAHIFDILENFNRRYHLSKDEIKENINSVYGQAANDHSHRDSVDSLRYAYVSSKGEKYGPCQLQRQRRIRCNDVINEKLRKVVVNGNYITAVWTDDTPATVIKLNENDSYDSEKAILWLLLKRYCDNNKSECDRVLEVFRSKTEVKKYFRKRS